MRARVLHGNPLPSLATISDAARLEDLDNGRYRFIFTIVPPPPFILSFTMKAPPQALEGAFMAFTISWRLQKPPLQARAWRGGFEFMVFLFSALCYTICTMKALPQVLEGPGEEPSWHLLSRAHAQRDKIIGSVVVVVVIVHIKIARSRNLGEFASPS